MSKPSSRKPSVSSIQDSLASETAQSVRSTPGSKPSSRKTSLSSPQTVSKPSSRQNSFGSDGEVKTTTFRHCSGRNPRLPRSWSQASLDSQNSNSRRGSLDSNASSRTASIVSETDNEDACVRQMIGLSRNDEMYLLKMKSKDHMDTAPENTMISFSMDPDEVEMDQMPWMRDAIRKAAPNGRRSSVILATSHVHKHKPKGGSGPKYRRGSNTSVLGEGDTNTLFFAPHAGRAGNNGLSLLTEESQIKRDPRTDYLYNQTTASQTIRFRTSKPLNGALLAVPDAPESLRMAAYRQRNFGPPKLSKK